jgi:hypothetical protein
VNHNSSELAWQRRDSTPFFHQSILWITTAASLHDSAGIAHLPAPEHSVNHNSSELAWQQDSTPFFHQSILWIMQQRACMAAQDSTPFLHQSIL